MTTTTLPPKRLRVFQDAYKLGLSTIKPLATLSRANRQDAQVSYKTLRRYMLVGCVCIGALSNNLALILSVL